jgi:hypothetical protein
MRPPLPPTQAFDLPRLHIRRANDVAQIAVLYAAGLTLVALVVTSVFFLPGGLAGRPDQMATFLLIASCIVAYIVVGGVVLAFAVRRLVFWASHSKVALGGASWLRVLAWPTTVGSMLLKAAFPSHR